MKRALHFAAQAGNKDVAELLIDKGAQVDSLGEHGTTPLMVALSSGKIETGKYLIDKGADIKAKLEEQGATVELK